VEKCVVKSTENEREKKNEKKGETDVVFFSSLNIDLLRETALPFEPIAVK